MAGAQKQVTKELSVDSILTMVVFLLVLALLTIFQKVGFNATGQHYVIISGIASLVVIASYAISNNRVPITVVEGRVLVGVTNIILLAAFIYMYPIGYTLSIPILAYLACGLSVLLAIGRVFIPR